MDDYTWKKRVAARRRRRQTERAILLLIVLFVVSGIIWYVTSYTKTPNYAMEEALTALYSEDAVILKSHLDVESITYNAYDDLTGDLFKYDTELSDHERSLFENFYVLIRSQMCQGAIKVIDTRIDTGEWTLPEEMLKGRQLGIDFDLLLERSLIRHTSIIGVENVIHHGDTATADINVVEDYTEIPFTLKVKLENFGGGVNIGGTEFDIFGETFRIPGISFKIGGNDWKIIRVDNYHEYLDAVSPALQAELSAYIDATNEIVEHYNYALLDEQAVFIELQRTSSGIIGETRRKEIAEYINGTIIPTLSYRQDELNKIPVPKAAEYLANLRKQSTTVTIQAWQFYSSGLLENNAAAFDTAESLHKQELVLDQRIEELIHNSAVARELPRLP